MGKGGPGADLAVTGGTVVAPSGTLRADVLVSGGRITALAEPGGGARAAERIDASGCLVLPGSVDAHCHLMSDVAAATRAAALGGTTTVLSFTNPEEDEDAVECLHRRRHELSRAGAAVDVGLHSMLCVPDRPSRPQLEALRRGGTCGIKIFLAYRELGIMWSAKGLLALMTLAAAAGQLLQVHCEDGDMIEGLLAGARASGHTGPRVFAETRPPAAEAAAVALVGELAALTGASCYLVHLSSKDALELVRLARRRAGAPLFAEACLHHLLLDDGHYGKADAERYLVAPPLRPPPHQAALWEALSDGTVDVLASDHAQRRSRTAGELSPDGKGYGYGVAGVGARLVLSLSEGLARGMTIERLVEVTTAAPARAFGLYPKKGALAPGSDADLVVFDPAGTTVIEGGTFADGTGDSLYAGARAAGSIRQVVLRGETIVCEGSYVAPGPSGAFVRPLPVA